MLFSAFNFEIVVKCVFIKTMYQWIHFLVKHQTFILPASNIQNYTDQAHSKANISKSSWWFSREIILIFWTHLSHCEVKNPVPYEHFILGEVDPKFDLPVLSIPLIYEIFVTMCLQNTRYINCTPLSLRPSLSIMLHCNDITLKFCYLQPCCFTILLLYNLVTVQSC